MTTQSEASTGSVEMLPGVRHYETSGFAQSWEAYDALTEEDGWKETYPDPADAPSSRWKRGTVNGRAFVVHAPTPSLDEATGSGRR